MTKRKSFKQFCIHNHDTFIIGRNKYGRCNQCDLIRKRKDPSKDARKTQICPNGHDKNVVGRRQDGTCAECSRQNVRNWEIKNPVHNKLYQDTPQRQKYLEEHKQAQAEYMKVYIIERLKTDISFRLIFNLRARLRTAIKGNYKSGSAVKDLGCSIEFFKQYIEDKFYGSMTWDNWGTVWQLDHTKALMFFDLTDRNQFKKAVHYTNLQPLTIPDHQKKTAEEMQLFRKRLVK